MVVALVLGVPTSLSAAVALRQVAQALAVLLPPLPVLALLWVRRALTVRASEWEAANRCRHSS
jgi:hypothetical protein